MAYCLSPIQCRHHHTRKRCQDLNQFWPAWPWGKQALPLVLTLTLVGLGGCGTDSRADSSAADRPPQPFVSMPNPQPSLQRAARLTQARARRLVPPSDPFAVTLYTLDDRCESFRGEPIQVPRQESLSATVGVILAEQTIADLTLSGYRVEVQPTTGTAIIDLRVARDSPRRLQSLSVCEQKALFGSLQQTLVNQPDWGIETVVFTQRGHPLVL